MLIALSFIAALSACTVAQNKSSDAKPVPKSAPAEVANPMASFARMIPGEWRMTVQSGTSLFHNWHWGPGKHSMRRMTDGLGAAGEPWRELEVCYWHPGRKQVCLLNMHPDVPGIGRGVGEGSIKFEGETADAVYDLYQPGVRRKIGLRWVFDGPDKYRATLSEATGTAGYKPLAEWDLVRIKPPTLPRPRVIEETSKPSKNLKVLESLLGHTWEGTGNWVAGGAVHTQLIFEWVPLAEVIYARVLVPSKDGIRSQKSKKDGGQTAEDRGRRTEDGERMSEEPTHVLDAYFYQHIGTNALRCLALSNQGGVYEGNLTVLDGGALQTDLKGYEGDRVVSYVVRLDFAQDGALRQRVWSVNGAERKLMLDVQHKKLESKNG
jgi:hypothetical protein